jgi:hypothetical protein
MGALWIISLEPEMQKNKERLMELTVLIQKLIISLKGENHFKIPDNLIRSHLHTILLIPLFTSEKIRCRSICSELVMNCTDKNFAAGSGPDLNQERVEMFYLKVHWHDRQYANSMPFQISL